MTIARNNRTAYRISVETDRWLRGAFLRIGCLGVYAAAGALDAAEERPGGAWLLVPGLVLIPVIGTYLALLAAIAERRANQDRELVIRDPVSDFAVRQIINSKGTFIPNISAALEFLGAATLGVGLYWFTDTLWAVVALAAVVTYLGSISANLFLDPTFYNPDVPQNSAMEVLRVLAGPVTAGVATAVTFGAFHGDGRIAALATCCALLSLGPRIRQTDQMMIKAEDASRDREIFGRSQILKGLHDNVGNAIEPLRHLVDSRREAEPELHQAVQNVDSSYRETLMLDHDYEITINWPGVLFGRLDALAGKSGAKINFAQPGGTINIDDRKVARLVVDDLARNATEAASLNVHVRLIRDGREWRVEVADDGHPVNPATWMRPGGGLARLARLLAPVDGYIARSDNPKVIAAAWKARDGDPEQER